MARKLSAKGAADQISCLIKGDHYKDADKVVEAHPTLEVGLAEYKNRQQACKPAGSGSARLSR